MQILLGTTNPSKFRRFASLLDGSGCTFLSPHDLGITADPDETGSTPEENARLKAAFYGQYADYVLCEDSGLYLAPLSLDDPRQPGLSVRTPLGGKRLDDEEMIAYYASLISSIGGRADAYYLDAYAVCVRGTLTSFMDDALCRTRAFVMTDIPSEKRHPGWPLDSISLYRGTDRYFVDGPMETDPVAAENYREKTTEFLRTALELR